MTQECQLMVTNRNLVIEYVATSTWKNVNSSNNMCTNLQDVHPILYKEAMKTRKLVQGLHLAHTVIISNQFYKDY